MGLESMFFAQSEEDQRDAINAQKVDPNSKYDPDKAFTTNLLSSVPQMLFEKAFGVERLLQATLDETVKRGGKVLFGDFARNFVRKGTTSAIEEGLTEPAQGFWNDYIASLTYDQSRERAIFFLRWCCFLRLVSLPVVGCLWYRTLIPT